MNAWHALLIHQFQDPVSVTRLAAKRCTCESGDYLFVFQPFTTASRAAEQRSNCEFSEHDYSCGSLVENGLASVRPHLAGVLELDSIQQFVWNRISLQVTGNAWRESSKSMFTPSPNLLSRSMRLATRGAPTLPLSVDTVNTMQAQLAVLAALSRGVGSLFVWKKMY
ncbi:hypothetical protein ISCGN_023480 [Ixodes scapularis]